MAKALLTKLLELYEKHTGNEIAIPVNSSNNQNGSTFTIKGLSIDTSILESLCKPSNEAFIRTDILSHWIKFPAPPDNFSSIDIILLLMSSVGYSMNPFTFPLSSASHEFYITFWKLLSSRIAVDRRYKTFAIFMRGRSAAGYLSALSLRNIDNELDVEYSSVDEEILNELSINIRYGDRNYGSYFNIMSLASVSEHHLYDDLHIIDLLGSRPIGRTNSIKQQATEVQLPLYEST